MKRIYFVIFILCVTIGFSIDSTSPSYNLYKKGMSEYYLNKDINRAARLFAIGIKRDETFLGNYLGVFRYYIKKDNFRYAKQAIDRAWDDCRRHRKVLILVKARYLLDVKKNRTKTKAFLNWASKKYRFRKLLILKRRAYLANNYILRVKSLRLGRKYISFSSRRYRRRKLFLFFWHPDVPNMGRLIKYWYKKTKRMGFKPFLFTTVSRRIGRRFLRRNRIRYKTFYSNRRQDLAKLFGIDLMPHSYFLGRDNEVLYSGHPSYLTRRDRIKFSRM